jgi:site-specific DNA recombinase
VDNLKAIRAAAYARYSSDNQREESITAQLRAIEEYCKRNGYVLVKIYSDEAKSATTDQRLEFQQMIADSELGLFDVLVIHKFDRFARNRYDSAFYKRKLKLNKVNVESILEQLDNSPESVILESVLEGMAEYYSKNLAREVRKGLAENADKGLHNGGRPPYGLKVNPQTRQYEIDETRFKAVQMYFEGVAAGIPLAEIARRINAAGFRTYTGDEFKITSFDTWAYNRKYKGDYTWDVVSKKAEDGKRNSHLKKPVDQQTIKTGVIPAIVSDELWERVNSLMKERQHTGGRMKAKVVYLLSGKVHCGNPECRSSYVGESYPSRGKVYAYYKCSGKCGNKNVKKDDLEGVVVDRLLATCFTPEAMMAIAKRVKELYAKRHNSIESEIEPIKKEIQSLDTKLNNWIDALGEGLLDKSVLANKIREANEKKVFLESQLTQAEIIKSTHDIDESVIIKVMENKKHLLFSDNAEDRKQVLQEYIDSVVVLHSSDGGLDVKLTVRVFNGGGEGICTPVSKSNYRSIYECSLCFLFRPSRLPKTGCL